MDFTISFASFAKDDIANFDSGYIDSPDQFW